MLVGRRSEPLWPTTSVVGWGCERSATRRSANSPAELQRWFPDIRYGSNLAGSHSGNSAHYWSLGLVSVVPALAAGGSWPRRPRAWLLGVRLGWIMAVEGIAWSLHGQLPMGSERPGCMPLGEWSGRARAGLRRHLMPDLVATQGERWPAKLDDGDVLTGRFPEAARLRKARVELAGRELVRREDCGSSVRPATARPAA